MSDNQNITCSFCGKGRKDVTKMIVGADKVTICNECIKLCNEIKFFFSLKETYLFNLFHIASPTKALSLPADSAKSHFSSSLCCKNSIIEGQIFIA